jgi:cyclopropane fatty-acyl-phospholipid synthase-like methyltransferase
MQYLDKKEIEDFISNSLHHLTDDGKICLFDIVDSRTFTLWKAGLFNNHSFNFTVMLKLLINQAKGIIKKLRGKPFYELGYLYPPSFFVNLAQKYNLKISCCNSMYYEYRYHIILRNFR